MTPRKDPAWRRWGEGLQPLPETREAIDELEPVDEVEDVLEDLLERGRRVREMVPDCVGLSLATMTHGVTLTLVASDLDIAILDALQYLDAGPCVEAAARAEVVTFNQDDPEGEWQLFAEATAAVGVRSTLTLPILAGAEITGSVNLYAASPRAFEGLHEEVAEVFSAWAPGAIRNADLSFATRELARAAPQILRNAAKVDVAVGVLLAALDLEEQEARRRLRDAAVRGGVEEVTLAEVLLGLLGK
jgi:GAF domain-containing protein